MARLDRLAPVKEISQIGAAIGREFSYSLMRELVGRDETALKHALTKLEQAELVFRRGEPRKRSIALSTCWCGCGISRVCSRATSSDSAGQIARAMKEKFPDIVVSQPEIVAHHFTEAGLAEPAIDYSLKAGNLALSRFPNVAVGHLKEGLKQISNIDDPVLQQVRIAASNVAPETVRQLRAGAPTV